MVETNEDVTPAAAQPGQVVSPGGMGPQDPQAPPTPVPQQVSQQIPEPAPPRPAPASGGSVPSASSSSATRTTDGVISWTASEFVAHEKSGSWYLALAGIAVVMAAVIFLMGRDIISIIVVLVAAVCFGVLGSRKPRQQQYTLSASGLSVGQKHYSFSAFRSFAVVPEGAFSSVVFMPLKRFAPLTTIYYAPEDEDKIVDLISASLPFEERKTDPIDNLMGRIRF